MIRLLVLVALAGALLWILFPRMRAAMLRWAVPAAVVLLALLYVRSPIDLIPDVSPVGFLDDLILLGSSLWWARKRLQQSRANAQPQSKGDDQPHADASSESKSQDPYDVLGVERGASDEEITRAYRVQMKKYHPDRVAGLGEELREVAHRRAQEIQRAYETLRRS